MPGKLTIVAMLSSLIAIGGVAFSQNSESPDADIVQLIRTYDNAWNKKDAAKVESMLGPDYVYFSSKGVTESRQQVLGMLRSPKYALAAAERSEVKIYRTGSTAVVGSRWKGHGTYDGREFHDDQRCSIVLGQDKQRWQVLAEQCTQIVAP
jgi:ketosteroid isomerase-like protein